MDFGSLADPEPDAVARKVTKGLLKHFLPIILKDSCLYILCTYIDKF
jgi:hypothetical protein